MFLDKFTTPSVHGGGNPLEQASPKSLSATHPCDYSAVRRSPPHRWLAEHRITLIILRDCYELGWSDVRAIFNTLFAKCLASSQGLSKEALIAMYYQLRKGNYDASGDWWTLKSTIENQAEAIGITLNAKADGFESKIKQSLGYRGTLTRNAFHTREYLENTTRSMSDDLDKNYDSDNTLVRDEFLFDRTPTRISGHRPPHPFSLEIPALQGRPLLKAIEEKAERRLKELPRIAFRAWSSKSMGLNGTYFCAGMFTGYTTIPEPPPWSSEEYRNHAARHIGRTPMGVTPFVSLSVNPIRVIHHAVKHSHNSFIAIIDVHKVVDSAVDKLSKIRWVDELHLDTGYSGTGELIVWGSISENAIISRISLRELLSSMPAIEEYSDPWGLRHFSATSTAIVRRALRPLPLTFLTGKACGRLAEVFKMPPQLVESLVYRIVRDWRFEHWASFSSNWVFMTGVRLGYEEHKSFVSGGFEKFLHSLEEVLESEKDCSISQFVGESSSDRCVTSSSSEENGGAMLAALSNTDFRAEDEQSTVRDRPVSKDSRPLVADANAVVEIKADYNAALSERSSNWIQAAGWRPGIFLYAS